MEGKLPVLKPYQHLKTPNVKGNSQKVDSGTKKGSGLSSGTSLKSASIDPFCINLNHRKNHRHSLDVAVVKANQNVCGNILIPTLTDHQQNQLDYKFKYFQLESLFLENEKIAIDLRNEVKQSRSDSDQLKSQLQQFQGESIQLKSELLALQSEVAQLKFIIKAGDSETNSIRNELFQARNELLELKEKMNDFFLSENMNGSVTHQIPFINDVSRNEILGDNNNLQSFPSGVLNSPNTKENDTLKTQKNDLNKEGTSNDMQDVYGDISHQLDTSMDFQEDDYQDVLNQLKQIKKVLHDHTIEPMGLINHPQKLDQSDSEGSLTVQKTVFVDKIYRTDSKEIIVQVPKIVDNDSEIEHQGKQKVEDLVSITSILKPSVTLEKENHSFLNLSSPFQHVDANQIINTLPTANTLSTANTFPTANTLPTTNTLPATNPPPLYPLKGKSELSNLSVSYQDILFANDRYIEKISAPEWKPVNDENNYQEIDEHQAETESRSPSPTKSMLIKERDALEEELLQQYETLRSLLTKN